MSLFGKQGNSLDEILNRPRPSAWQQFMKQPCVFLTRKLYTWQSTIAAQPVKDPVPIVCISDTHNRQSSLPDGDILIHAGDLTQSGSLKELQVTLDWLRTQPHASKIVIAGNHDLCLGSDINRLKAEDETPDWGDIVYLQDSEVSITCNNGRHLNIYGSPYSPRHGNWTFQYPRSEDFWGGRVPANIDILITHTLPRAHLDLLNLGCTYLLRTLWRVRPRLHVFGHVHEGAGTEWLQFDALQSAYERTVVTGGGIWNVIYTMKEFVMNFFRPTAEAKCLLVKHPSWVVSGITSADSLSNCSFSICQTDSTSNYVLNRSIETSLDGCPSAILYTNSTWGCSSMIFITKNCLLLTSPSASLQRYPSHQRLRQPRYHLNLARFNFRSTTPRSLSSVPIASFIMAGLTCGSPFPTSQSNATPS